jgi:hypothetical protein
VGVLIIALFFVKAIFFILMMRNFKTRHSGTQKPDIGNIKTDIDKKNLVNYWVLKERACMNSALHG